MQVSHNGTSACDRRLSSAELLRQTGYAQYDKLENCPPGETVYYVWTLLLPELPVTDTPTTAR